MNEKAIVAPGVYDCISAKIAERVGFEAVYMTGYGTSMSRLGQADVGLLTETEMVQNAGLIARAVEIPVVADADTGYGNAINVTRTVLDYEAQGVAAIHIEDQVSPKRCGHMKGKELISEEEMIGKIRAAIDSRRDDDFVIIARTDARGAVGGSLDLAIRRSLAYAKAGADVIFSEFTMPSEIEARKFASAIHERFPEKPLLFNYSTAFQWHKSTLSFNTLEKLGYHLIIVPLQAARAAMYSTWDFFSDLRRQGELAIHNQERRLARHPTKDYQSFVGFPRIIELERDYLPAREVLKRYRDSQGFV